MRERLTGAIILVALIVVLVPELLSGPIRPAARARGATPSAEEAPLRSYTIDLRDETRGASGASRPQPASPATPLAASAEPAPVPPPASSAAPASSAEQPPAAGAIPAPAAIVSPPSAVRSSAPQPASSPASAATSAAGWMVQLGSFADRANAERLAQQVRALGFAVGISRGTTGRRLYRVQVGPAHDRSGAEQILSKLRAQGHNGSVVPK